MATKKLTYDNPLLRDLEEPKRPGRPKKDNLIRNRDGGNSSQEGLTEDATRFSAIVKVENVENLKNYAYTKRITIREALDSILENFFEEYQKNPKNEKLLDRNRKGHK